MKTASPASPEASDLTCPSAPCAPGATLLGVMGADGVLDYLRTPMLLDADVADDMRAGAVPPEARMRFAAPCQETGCAQWTGEGCGVVRKVMRAVEDQGGLPAASSLQPCVIRASCRWYDERGAPACNVCKHVITDQEAAQA